MGWTREGPIVYHDDMFPARIPVNFHVGCMGLPPASHDFVDSIPPMVTGGNIDNARIGVGTTMYYPVEVPGALLSMGDAHAAQGDSELDGTGVETSITGKFRVTVIKKEDFTEDQTVQDFPLGETEEHWLVHGYTETNYLATYADEPAAIYANSALEPAVKNAYTQTRKFLMAKYGLTEAETNTIITQGIDFAVTQGCVTFVLLLYDVLDIKVSHIRLSFLQWWMEIGAFIRLSRKSFLKSILAMEILLTPKPTL